MMQKSTISNEKKRNLLLIITCCTFLLSVGFSLSRNFSDDLIYFVIHTVSIILGLFLSIVSALTFSEFKTRRLFLILCAFVAITLAEGVSIINFVIPIMPMDDNLHSLVTHSMILLMLSFFSIGIFRTD